MKVFIGVKEKSSNKIATQIINKIPKNIDIDLYGSTGLDMEKCGVKSIFNVKDIDFMNIFDAILNIFTITKRYKDTINWIVKNEPEIAIFVDGYDFYIRVAKKIKEQNCKTKIICVVAPLHVLYLKKEFNKVNKYFDQLICIFAFEKELFINNGHKNVHYFGNPFLENVKDLKLIRDKNLILITIGSRINEIKRHLPIILSIIKLLNILYKDIKFFIPTNVETHDKIEEYFQNIKNVEFSLDEEIKENKMQTAYFSIVKSGTNATEMCFRGLPSITYYKINLLDFIIRIILKINFVNIVNIVAKKEIIPEIVSIRKNYIIKNIIKKFKYLYDNTNKIDDQMKDIKEPMKLIYDNITNNDFGYSVSNLIFK